MLAKELENQLKNCLDNIFSITEKCEKNKYLYIIMKHRI